MKRVHRFVDPIGVVRCTLPSGERVDIPVVPGLLKHPSVQELPVLLEDVDVLRKYTIEALRRGTWNVVRRFPREWLEACMETAAIPEGRLRALRFMLSDATG